MLKLYNTLTKKVEEISKKDHLNLYSCGPTVYNYAHIGNLRAFIVADLLYRTLKYGGYNPKWVMNITDIEDKIIKATIAEKGQQATVEDLKKVTNKYLEAFIADLKEVNVSVEDITFFEVTDAIPQIQDFVVKLIEKGYAYKADDGSTYFSIEKYQKDFGDYGELVGPKFIAGKKVGARVKVDEYEKDNLSDFALWKAHDESIDAQIFWDHLQLGKGRPGWHIECSVINHVAFKGEPTDIHTGGVDLIFPHHTNEIAQSQALLGKNNFVHRWFHSEHLLVDGKKMAKSANNFYTLADLKDKGFDGQDLRYLMLSSSYRAQQNFTFEDLLSAKRARERFVKPSTSTSLPEAFLQAIDQDLNFAKAVGAAIEVTGLAAASDITGVLENKSQTEIPPEIDELLKNREQAKNEKDFSKSDELRKQIEAFGFELMDTPEGQKVKKRIRI